MKYKYNALLPVILIFLVTICNVKATVNFPVQLKSDTVNPNVKIFRNIAVYEFFSSQSFSAIDLYRGASVTSDTASRDIELADSTGMGRDRFFLRSGDGTQDNFIIGQETKFCPFFNTRGVGYSQIDFDTITRIEPGHPGPILPSDFYLWSIYSIGRNFASSDLRVYGFWLKGKKLAYGLPKEVYGILYLKSVETVNIGGIETYKLTVDIKININGDNDFRLYTVGINPLENEVTSNYFLSQNYPNPFNPSTNIKFSLPKNGFTKLTIYDSNGKEIQSVLNQDLKQGSYEFNWNASQFPSGVYFYKLEVNGFSEMKKMVLIK